MGNKRSLAKIGIILTVSAAVARKSRAVSSTYLSYLWKKSL